MKMTLLSPFLFLVLISSTVSLARGIEDGGHFFSPSAISEGERVIDEINRLTQPHKEVLVKTVPSWTGNPVAEAERVFSTRRLDGVLVFLVKKPHRIVVTVGKQTERAFTNKEGVKTAFLEKFKQKDFDGGLLAGLGVLRQDLVAGFPQASQSPTVYKEAEGNGIHWIWFLLIGAVGVFILVRLLTPRTPTYSRGPDGQPIYNDYGGGGGGFGRSFLGGIFGAVAGSWLYDRFTGNDHNTYAGSNHDNYRDSGSSTDLSRTDDGAVGSSSSDSWDDSSSSSSSSDDSWSSSDSGGSFDSGDSGGSFDSGSSDSGGGDW